MKHRHMYRFIGRSRWVRNYVFKCEACHASIQLHPFTFWGSW